MKKTVFFRSCAVLLLLTLSACSRTDRPLTSQELAPRGAYAADISPDGRYAVFSSIHHGIMLWDLLHNQLRYRWRQQSAAANTVYITRFSPDGSHVVTSTRNTFVIWSVQTGKALGFYSEPESTIRDITISNSGRYVLLGRTDGKVEHVDLQTGRRIKFLAHTEQINSVDLSGNGRFALTGGNDYTAYFWDTKTAQVIQRFDHASRVSKVALDSKGRFAFTAASKRQSRIWILKTGKVQSTLNYLSRQQIYSFVRFSDDQRYLMTGAPSRDLSLWLVDTGNQVQKWRVTPGKNTRPESAVVYSVALNSQRQELTSLSSSGLVETWKIKP